MRKALLFDLDGTLISNSTETFLPPYFSALTKKLETLVPPEKLVQQLRASTMLMMQNNDPLKTNADVFSADFFPKIGLAREQLMPILDDFYLQEYRDLVVYTKPVEGAREIVAKAFEMHFPVVIATAPVYPLTALQQRLQWGNLGDFQYNLITDYESMHTCKPNPAYYLEIAKHLERSPDECVMIGNEVQMDIVPARRAGMKTFWVTDAGGMPTDVPTDWRGTLEDFGELMASGEL